MSSMMELLRAPALGMVVMIIILGGAILISALAALVAQVSLLLRLKPWNGVQTGQAAPAVFSTAQYNAADVVEGVWQEVH